MMNIKKEKDLRAINLGRKWEENLKQKNKKGQTNHANFKAEKVVK